MEQRLETSEIKELILIHKTLKHKKDADKIKCLIYWGKGWSWEEIKEALFVDDHYIYEIKKRYKAGKIEEVLKNHFQGHNNKMTNEQEIKLCDFIDNNFVANAKIACNFVKEKFNIIYTQQGMVITLRRLEFSFKKPKIVPGKIPSQEKQIEVADEINGISDNLKEDEDLLYLDGAGMVHNIKLGYGWIKKGIKKVIKTNTGREKMNINGLYNPNTNEVICIEQDGKISVTQETNIELFEKYKKFHPEKHKVYIVMDNARSNKSKKLKEYIENSKDLKIIPFYLPPYSPNLNLIERLWKYSKKILLSVYIESYKDFKERIIDFFEDEIKSDFHKEKLSIFIGKKFEIINSN
jgi:transposase